MHHLTTHTVDDMQQDKLPACKYLNEVYVRWADVDVAKKCHPACPIEPEASTATLRQGNLGNNKEHLLYCKFDFIFAKLPWKLIPQVLQISLCRLLT